MEYGKEIWFLVYIDKIYTTKFNSTEMTTDIQNTFDTNK